MELTHQLKLCKDCDFKRGIFCTQPDTQEIDLVDGSRRDQSCASLRYGQGICGREAKFFSPKQYVEGGR